MPIYDYRCDHCAHAFSAVQRFADDAIAACPSCGKPPRRLLSNPALVFKGSGWYKTDSRGPEKKDTPSGLSGDPAAKTAETTGTTEGNKTDASDKPSPAAGEAAASKTDKAAGASKAGDSRGGASAPAKKPEKAAPASS